VAYNSGMIVRGNVTIWLEEREPNRVTALTLPLSARIVRSGSLELPCLQVDFYEEASTGRARISRSVTCTTMERSTPHYTIWTPSD
jgi:hypothetical protein